MSDNGNEILKKLNQVFILSNWVIVGVILLFCCLIVKTFSLIFSKSHSTARTFRIEDPGFEKNANVIVEERSYTFWMEKNGREQNREDLYWIKYFVNNFERPLKAGQMHEKKRKMFIASITPNLAFMHFLLLLKRR